METGFIREKKYYDDKNYPHGFSRSGDYTIHESEVLEDFGTRLSALATGKAQPQTDLEKHFVDVVANPEDFAGELSFIEKTWLKYQRLITEVKRVYILADGNNVIFDEGIE
ncbi:hypothetical protein CJP74_02160 [Psittacicella melopsittaci]|uniref:Macrodomain Ori protein n=1 Tax=Psittacicella melopsittaci TaxID=2028576 RepID=A0A3A1Y6W5_9GAMM|nr:DUF413 domain-containing protein [Psittacicella melopsittaci]RIY33251.1 hypothetical protein CJP74_02160 [Psittacicella melopsittaci]